MEDKAGFVDLHVRRPHAETKVGETRAVNDVTLYETGLWFRDTAEGHQRPGGSSLRIRDSDQPRQTLIRVLLRLKELLSFCSQLSPQS